MSTFVRRFAIRRLLLPLALAVFAPPSFADSLPVGAVSLFNSIQCPTGWAPLLSADGYFFLPLMEGGHNMSRSGEALNPGADPQHKHMIASSINIEGTQFVAIGGCCNDSLRRACSTDVWQLSPRGQRLSSSWFRPHFRFDERRRFFPRDPL